MGTSALRLCVIGDTSLPRAKPLRERCDFLAPIRAVHGRLHRLAMLCDTMTLWSGGGGQGQGQDQAWDQRPQDVAGCFSPRWSLCPSTVKCARAESRKQEVLHLGRAKSTVRQTTFPRWRLDVVLPASSSSSSSHRHARHAQLRTYRKHIPIGCRLVSTSSPLPPQPRRLLG